MQRVKVKLIGEGKFRAIVEYNNVKYEVKRSELSNHITVQERGGFVTYAWILTMYLTKEWNP